MFLVQASWCSILQIYNIFFDCLLPPPTIYKWLTHPLRSVTGLLPYRPLAITSCWYNRVSYIEANAGRKLRGELRAEIHILSCSNYRSVLKIRSRRIGLTPTFSCHGSFQARLALLIWLIEKVLQAIGTQNVSWRGCVAGYTTDETWRFETDRCRRRLK